MTRTYVLTLCTVSLIGCPGLGATLVVTNNHPTATIRAVTINDTDNPNPGLVQNRIPVIIAPGQSQQFALAADEDCTEYSIGVTLDGFFECNIFGSLTVDDGAAVFLVPAACRGDLFEWSIIPGMNCLGSLSPTPAEMN